MDRYSVLGNSELNVAFSDSAVRALRSELFLEHLAIATSDMDDRSPGETNWQGLAFHRDAETSGGG
jgi:hypothetical protein